MGGKGEVRKWKVREPERLVGDGKDGELCHLWSREDAGRILIPEDLPIGRYFYHNAPIGKVPEIQQKGLVSSLEEVWRLRQYGEPVPAEPEDRLYLYTRGDDCLAYLDSHFDFERRINVPEQTPLRFLRRVLDGRPIHFDGRYDGRIFSTFVTDVTIPSASLEVCRKWWKKWDDEVRHFAGHWEPLMLRE